MGGLGEDVFVPGRLVWVKRGACAGRWCVVLGRDLDGRVLVADGDCRSVLRPKRKNPKHLQPSSVVIEEVARLVSGGGSLNDGRIVSLISTRVGTLGV